MLNENIAKRGRTSKKRWGWKKNCFIFIPSTVCLCCFYVEGARHGVNFPQGSRGLKQERLLPFTWVCIVFGTTLSPLFRFLLLQVLLTICFWCCFVQLSYQLKIYGWEKPWRRKIITLSPEENVNHNIVNFCFNVDVISLSNYKATGIWIKKIERKSKK
jgi:hypothetical protein